MRLPPASIVRGEPPPDNLLLVVRGGANSLTDGLLERATTDTWEAYRFFGVSVFAAPGDDLAGLSRREAAIRRRPELRVARVGELRTMGFDVVPTFSNPAHFSIVMAEATLLTFDQLRSCFSDAQPNPGYERDR
ncbi:MAG: hypothetical protein NVSMB4_19610 [Acidimicrobiales bacterium]